jgi:hypothetical protein
MTTLKTIAATALIAVGGTVAAFTGLHLGQSPADAATQAQPTKAQTTYSVTMTAQDIAKLAALMNGQQTKAAAQVKAHDRSRTHQKRQVHQKQQTTHRASTHSSTDGGTSYAHQSTSHYYGDGHSSCGGTTHHSGGSDHGSGGCD